jgi:hypothetical protein
VIGKLVTGKFGFYPKNPTKSFSEMSKKINVLKHSGEEEVFEIKKLESSLENSGANSREVQDVIAKLKPLLYDGMPTKVLYKLAFKFLKTTRKGNAARYSLRKSIMDLGPSGFPFEHFAGALMETLGYEVKLNQTVKGRCVSHELDVVGRNNKEVFMAECKFYNRQGKHCSVQVPLYINSRFQDVKYNWDKDPANNGLEKTGVVVTNTRFTADAQDYGKCVGLRLISWDYPRGKSLKEMIEDSGLFPITVLTSLTRKQTDYLLNNKVVLCRQLLSKPEAFGKLGLSVRKQREVLAEVRELVGM